MTLGITRVQLLVWGGAAGDGTDLLLLQSSLAWEA